MDFSVNETSGSLDESEEDVNEEKEKTADF